MNDATIAVAGWGKTERLAEAVAKERHPERTLVLTYTETNQHEDAIRIVRRMSTAAERPICPTVMGWKAFQLREIVRPYLPMHYPNVRLRGLSSHDVDLSRRPTGSLRYLSKSGDAYPSLLGKLTLDVIDASRGEAIRRLEWLYDAIYIDEAQDLRGNDLCVLERLFKSNIDVHVFLDPRQSTLSTAIKDRKYKDTYPYAKLINLSREWETRGLVCLSYENTTHRSICPIALFSDLIIGDELQLGSTTSAVKPRGRHDGIYIISMNDIERYTKEHTATLLALRKSAQYGIPNSMNFRKAKGMTRDDVTIVATKPIEKFLRQGVPLKPESVCSFYVAVTRARYSVAIAVEKPLETLRAMNHPDSMWCNLAAKSYA